MDSQKNKKYKISLVEDSDANLEKKISNVKDFIQDTGNVIRENTPKLTRKGIKGLSDVLDSKGVQNEKVTAETEKIFTEIETEKIDWHDKVENIKAKEIKNEREKMINDSMKDLIAYLKSKNKVFYINKDGSFIILDE